MQDPEVIAKLKIKAKELDPKKKDDAMQAGTTATTVLVTKDLVICANAGDSRTVVSKFGGEPDFLSVDHKPDNELEKARIEAAKGSVQNGRVNGALAVSRALGDFEFKGRKELDPCK